MADVLIVEDDVSLSRGVAMMLRRAGLESIAVETSEEAIAAVQEKRFACLLLDVMLREFASGFYVVEALRQIPPEERPYVIVMTAAKLSSIVNFDRSLVKSVFLKPVDLDVLVSTVRAAVRSHQREETTLGRDGAEQPPSVTTGDVTPQAARTIEALRKAAEHGEDPKRIDSDED